MTIPQRYKDIKEYFESLEVAGEILDENHMRTDIKKYQNYVSIVTKTSLSKMNNSSYLIDHYFRYGPLIGDDPFKDKNNDYVRRFNMHSHHEDDYHFYIPFSLGMDRKEDKIWFEGCLPLISYTMDGERNFASQTQIIKMYENGIGYNFKRLGIKNVSFSHSYRQYLNVSGLLDINHSVAEISKIYNLLRNEAIFKFKNLLKEK